MPTKTQAQKRQEKLEKQKKAAELRHLQQDDSDPDRVTKIKWDEIAETREALKKLIKKK